MQQVKRSVSPPHHSFWEGQKVLSRRDFETDLTILNSNKRSNIRVGKRGNSMFYHKESSSLSLTPRTDDGNTPPAASLDKRERTALWYKPKSLRHHKPGQVQILSTTSSYVWLLLHYYLQEKSHRCLWILHMQLETAVKYLHSRAVSSYRKCHCCHLSLHCPNLINQCKSLGHHAKD